MGSTQSTWGSSTHSTITLKGSAFPFSYKAAGFPLFNRLSTFDLHYIHHHRTFTRTTPPQHHHHGRPPKHGRHLERPFLSRTPVQRFLRVPRLPRVASLPSHRVQRRRLVCLCL